MLNNPPKTCRNSTGMATWTKWLIGVISVCLIIIMAGCAMICVVSYKAVEGVVNPKEAEKIYYRILDSEPLPPKRYKFSGGLDIAGTVMLSTVEDKKEHHQFVLTRIKDDNKQFFKGKTLTAENIREAVNTHPRGNGPELEYSEFKDGGTVKVGDRDVTFNISVNTIDGKKVDRQLIGAVCPEDGVMTLIQAISHRTNESIDMEATKDFLAHIKGFK